MKNYDVISAAEDVPTKKYVDDLNALDVKKTGDTMSGRLTVQGMSIGDHTQWGGWDAIENGASALIFASPPAADVVLQALGASGSIYLRPNGGDANAEVVLGASSATFAKPVVLPANPTQPLEAATKQYADTRIAVQTDQPTDGAEIWIDTDEPDPVMALEETIASLVARIEALEARLA